MIRLMSGKSILVLVGFLLIGGIQARSQASVPEFPDLEYAHVDTTRLLLDLYLPDNISGPYPVIVWVHGGGWRSGSKENVQGIFLTLSGYALVSINYRLSHQSPFPAQIHDCKAAIRWIRENAALFSLDPTHIGVWGASAGGHLASLLGTTEPADSLEGDVGGLYGVSSQVHAVCDWYGHSNLTTIFLYPSIIDHGSPNGPESRLLGAPILDNLDLAWRASPIAYVSSDDPPFLIMHGTDDVNVPYQQSVELDSALRYAGVPVEFHSYPGEGHGGGVFGTDSVRQRVKDFFNRNLKTHATTVQQAELLPETDGLLSAYPNPFNANTKIEFTLSRAGYVTLKVYNVLGEDIKTLIAGHHVAGAFKATWDASGMPSGVYFFRLRAGQYVQTKKVMLVR